MGRVALGTLVLGGAGAVMTTGADAAVFKHKARHKPHRVVNRTGAVYVETNEAPINQVVVFNRAANGTLSVRQRVPTGGVGAPSPACAMPPRLPICPIVDSQGEVNLAANGRVVFAVNAGSNTISSFLETSLGLILIDRKPSGGIFPISIDSRGNVVYVLNQLSGNIAGFRFASNGTMTAIPGSTQSLSTPGPAGAGAEVRFDPSGRTLTASERGTNRIDTFVLGGGGVAGPAIAHPSAAVGPFGFAFDSRNHLILSNALSQMAGAATTYGETPGGGLTPIDNKSTSGGAPCWVVVTPDNRFVYITNTTTKTIARFGLGADGRLTLLGTTPTLNTPMGPILFPTDEALSRDGRFLYVDIPSVFGGDISRIDEYRVGANGDLTLLASTQQSLPAGLSGVAAR
jgi:6-phosphogluconolactonase (cycloisomerase 2 family)